MGDDGIFDYAEEWWCHHGGTLERKMEKKRRTGDGKKKNKKFTTKTMPRAQAKAELTEGAVFVNERINLGVTFELGCNEDGSTLTGDGSRTRLVLQRDGNLCELDFEWSNTYCEGVEGRLRHGEGTYTVIDSFQDESSTNRTIVVVRLKGRWGGISQTGVFASTKIGKCEPFDFVLYLPTTIGIPIPFEQLGRMAFCFFSHHTWRWCVRSID